MRVVFTGQTGVCKSEVMEKLALKAARERGVPPNLEDEHTRRFVRIYSVDEKIKEELDGTITPFLDNFHDKKRRETWAKAFEGILEEIEHNESEHAFLALHNTFHRRGQFSSLVDWDLLLRFKPTVFVTLIDDVFDIWQRVSYREREMRTNSEFTISELLSWRSAETAATEVLANNLYAKPDVHSFGIQDLEQLEPKIKSLFGGPIQHFVFAVKHPVITLYRLLFLRDTIRVYAQFPITDARGKEARRNEVETFRRTLHEHFTVFDPLTIDELRFSVDERRKRIKIVDRWPIGLEEILVEETMLQDKPFSGLDFNSQMVIKNNIGNQTVSRDYQLISLSHLVAGYRPYIGRRVNISTGMDKELVYASSENKQAYLVHPRRDRRGGLSYFASLHGTVVAESTEKLIDELNSFQNNYRRSIKHEKTWE